jgi:Zn-dependent hydrolases, including glyoxylases
MVLNVEDANIRVISTPGHSIGSISVIVDNEVAIVGDALFGIFSNSVFPPFADDVKTLIDSWGKLLKTNCTLFLPAHGRPITRELLEREYNKMHSL